MASFKLTFCCFAPWGVVELAIALIFVGGGAEKIVVKRGAMRSHGRGGVNPLVVMNILKSSPPIKIVNYGVIVLSGCC